MVYSLYLSQAYINILLDLCDSEYDTAVYVRTVCDDENFLIAWNEDGCTGYRSALAFSLLEAGRYYIFVDGWGGASGRFQLEISGEVAPLTRSPTSTLTPTGTPTPTSTPTLTKTPTPDDLWLCRTILYGGENGDYAESLSQDSDGNFYLVGSSWENSIEGQPYAGRYDAILVKFNPNEEWLWSRVLGGSDDEFGFGVAADGFGKVFVVGSTKGSSWDDQPNSGGEDAFLSCFDQNGTKLWTRLFGGTDNEIAWAVAVDNQGGAYVTGYTYSPLFFGQTNHGNADIFLTHFDGDGNQVLTRLFGDLYPSPDRGWLLMIPGIFT